MLRKMSNYPTKEKQYCNTTLVATNNLRTIYIIYLRKLQSQCPTSRHQLLDLLSVILENNTHFTVTPDITFMFHV